MNAIGIQDKSAPLVADQVAASGGGNKSRGRKTESVTGLFGSAVLLLRSAPPIALTMSPWTKRKDAQRLEANQVELEQRIRDAGLIAF